MVIISNDFHKTEYITKKDGKEVRKILGTEPSQRTSAQKAWIRRVKKQLCGIKGCTCGGELGERGMQMYFWDNL